MPDPHRPLQWGSASSWQPADCHHVYESGWGDSGHQHKPWPDVPAESGCHWHEEGKQAESPLEPVSRQKAGGKTRFVLMFVLAKFKGEGYCNMSTIFWGAFFLRMRSFFFCPPGRQGLLWLPVTVLPPQGHNWLVHLYSKANCSHQLCGWLGAHLELRNQVRETVAVKPWHVHFCLFCLFFFFIPMEAPFKNANTYFECFSLYEKTRFYRTILNT